MEKQEYLRRYLIHILRNNDVYYITKEKIEREVYNLERIQKEIDEENEIINELFAIKNNEIRVNGKSSDKIERLLISHLNNISYLNNQKNKGNYFDIKNDDTLEDISEKIKNICIDGVIDSNVHKLTEEEEKLLEEASVKTLKKARVKGIEEERKYLQEIRKENNEIQKQKLEKERQELIDMGVIYDQNEVSKLTSDLKSARDKGIEEERKYIKEKYNENLESEKQEELEEIKIDESIFNDAKVYKLKNARKQGIQSERKFLVQN